MVSEINSAPPSQITALDQGANPVKPSDKAQAPAAPNATSNDSVTLTEQASRIDELTRAVEDIPVKDAEKVAQFRDAIESRNYQVDSEAVAEKFNAIEQILNAPESQK